MLRICRGSLSLCMHSLYNLLARVNTALWSMEVHHMLVCGRDKQNVGKHIWVYVYIVLSYSSF